MRIALVTETFYPAVDSTTTTLKATADRLVDLGHAVRIIAPGPGLGTYRGCDVVRVRPLEPTGHQVRAALDEFAPDLVQATSPRFVGRKALKHARRTGTPTIVIEQSPVLDLAADYWRAKVADRADRLLVTASWMVERAAELGVEAELWAPGVDPVAFTPTLRDEWLYNSWSKAKSKHGPRVVVGYVGSLHKRHGVRQLAALADIDGIRPVVIGDGPERDWLAKRLPDAKFTGPLQTGDLTIAMATLDVVVHPGEHETCCHAMREAGAAGVPVVAARSGGALDVVRHLETGMFHAPGSRGDLRRAVQAVVADPQRDLLGRQARVQSKLRTWTDAVDELIADHYPALHRAAA
ncbi:glycosyltransferase [Nocardioides panacisoli]|uniref:glycosyltransferase n=1 Tax=Nocardioides panacisoli TaxID=627624 RepID=UPI001C6336E0|nr:glycosyltransferase [Nocardioides panacisoli]QYJ02503.1 glycosyltransferase [Nocardioides panacisoli]